MHLTSIKTEVLKKADAVEVADVPDNAYIDGKVGDAAVKFLQEKRDQPFFLPWVSGGHTYPLPL